jgi:hypothetical protein
MLYLPISYKEKWAGLLNIIFMVEKIYKLLHIIIKKNLYILIP